MDIYHRETAINFLVYYLIEKNTAYLDIDCNNKNLLKTKHSLDIDFWI